MLIMQNKKKAEISICTTCVWSEENVGCKHIMQRGVTGVNKVLSVVSVDSGCNSVE